MGEVRVATVTVGRWRPTVGDSRQQPIDRGRGCRAAELQLGGIADRRGLYGGASRQRRWTTDVDAGAAHPAVMSQSDGGHRRRMAGTSAAMSRPALQQVPFWDVLHQFLPARNLNTRHKI